jgi:carboxypeptidase T
MKNIILLFLLVACTLSVNAQNEKYSRVKIYTGDPGMQKLSSLGIETDHGDYRKNVWFISDFNLKELQKIKNAGFKTEILIDDVVSHYILQQPGVNRTQGVLPCDNNAPQYPVPSNFSLGSMGGYFTYAEMLAHLDSMASKFPNLITFRKGIAGNVTLEGDSVWYVKISDNALIDEAEPEVLYSAVHHAREPGGMSQLIYYMWYLLEHYNSDPELTAIINNTELFFVPCINPDGYNYNYNMSPGGGGMWRKNRRDNLDGTFGVDLNRNYGFNWGFDDDGSSPFPDDETYRGTAPFSEPETQIMRDFSNSRDFSIALNYHTFGNLLIYPWGYQYSTYTPDSALYYNYGNLLTTYNGYTYGTADQTVGYIVNGSSDDWMYGEQVSKPKIFAMTPECGDAQFGFWPPSSEIIPLCQSNMFQNITTAHLAGKYAQLEETSPELIANGGGYIYFTLKQLGLDTTGTYTISLTPLTTNIIISGPAVSHSNLSVLQEINDSISFGLTTPMTNGDEIKFLLSIDNGQYIISDTVIKYFGAPVLAYATDCNSTTGWNGPQWGISTTVFYSPTASITDSPFGDYNSNDFKTIRLSNPVDLTTAIKASLTFYARWALEPNFDYVQVQGSSNNGSTWTALCGNYTVPGSQFQVANEPLYEGFQLPWVKEEINLDDYVGGTLLIRFVLASDNFQEYDGFYFDDITIEKVLPGTNGINEETTAAITSVMPNPSSSYTYVTLNKETINAEIVIYDATGRVTNKMTVANGTKTIRVNTENLSSGIYFIRLINKNRFSMPLKLIVN